MRTPPPPPLKEHEQEPSSPPPPPRNSSSSTTREKLEALRRRSVSPETEAIFARLEGPPPSPTLSDLLLSRYHECCAKYRHLSAYATKGVVEDQKRLLTEMQRYLDVMRVPYPTYEEWCQQNPPEARRPGRAEEMK